MSQPLKPNKLICESCGKTFECGAEIGTCWCFSVAIPQENLAQLKEQFQNCLCQECLQNSSLQTNSTTQGNTINEKTE